MLRTDDPFSVAPESGLDRRVEVALVLVAWLVFLTLSLRVLGPDSDNSYFNSDSAIPVLMANDNRPVTVFDTYYYGADRWGGWPLLIAKALHQNTGLLWTDQRLHYFRTTWVFIGLLVLVSLNVRAAPAVLLSAFIALFLEQYLTRRFFDLSQLYAWQFTALFLAWLCLRKLLAQPQRDESVLVKGILWGSAFYLCALLAIWSSVASAPFLAVLLFLEALRSRFLFPKPITKRRIGLAIVLLLAATASEFLMKLNYHHYGLKHFDNDYKTSMVFDRGYLYENLLKNWENLVGFPFFPLIAIAFCFVVGITIFILYARAAGKATRVFKDDTTIMIVALTAMAVLNFVMITCVNHVRVSFYANRFQTPTYVFGVVGGLLTIYLAIRFLANRIAATRYVLPLVLAGAFIWFCVEFPRPKVSEEYKTNQEIALTLARKAPRAILMGGYWETYIFAGLEPTNSMTPLPLEGRHVRIPWAPEMLRYSLPVVIEYQRSGFVPKGSLPPNEVWQYGHLLKLQEPRFYENGELVFALYFNDIRKP